MKFIGVELDSLSGRIARARFPQHDVRIESFADTRLPRIDAVIGNPPFADVKLDYHGERLALHDFFIRKSLAALQPGGVLALVTSHFTLDKQNAAGARRLRISPIFLELSDCRAMPSRTRGPRLSRIFSSCASADGEPNHIDVEWTQTGTKEIDGKPFAINKYFLNHPEMVLGAWSTKDSLYGNGYSLKSNGNLATQLEAAIERLPKGVPQVSHSLDTETTQPIAPSSPEKHVSEGSFFVGPYHHIFQVVDGKAEQVVYSSTKLMSNGTMTGKRLASLIRLRDQARQVLRSQNEGWPEIQREEERRELNRFYDSFVGKYGPINLTTFSETKDGSVMRRMPNLAKFREDPDAMLVMSLEEYDDVTGEAKKSPIMSKDVVGQSPPISEVKSAEDGLLVSLDQKGAIDLSLIAQLYGKSESIVIDELGDLIYLDPETQQWETADAYLSGNVRAKLISAEKAGVQRNVEALKGVQPEDVLPGDIDANFGAPWIPVQCVEAFAADLFRVDPDAIKIGHLEQEAVWSVEGSWEAERSVANTSEYGTTRVTGISLLDRALNMKTPIVYDRMPDDSMVVNQEDTLAAKQKQRLIKEKFRQWIFADPDRTERLVRLYNDLYNNLRLRHFDGSHLKFPGMSAAISLRQSQKDAIWRCMSGGNTLLAHVVGGGKTWIMAGTAMKMRQTGLHQKPLIVVPNHLLEQFAREFMQLYPDAKLLIASKDEFTRDRRKLMTAKIASGDWDAVIVTHSSFEKIGMSREYQEKFLREQIEEYDGLSIAHAPTNPKRHSGT